MSINCPKCGSSDLDQFGGGFVCWNCGCEFSPDDGTDDDGGVSVNPVVAGAVAAGAVVATGALAHRFGWKKVLIGILVVILAIGGIGYAVRCSTASSLQTMIDGKTSQYDGRSVKDNSTATLLVNSDGTGEYHRYPKDTYGKSKKDTKSVEDVYFTKVEVKASLIPFGDSTVVFSGGGKTLTFRIPAGTSHSVRILTDDVNHMDLKLK